MDWAFFSLSTWKLQWVTGVRPHVGVVAEGTVASVGPRLCGDWAQEDGLVSPVLGGGALVLGDVISIFGEDKYFIVDFGETLQLRISPQAATVPAAGEGGFS